MIIQLAGILSTLVTEGIGIGRQFLERELTRDSRRAQRDLIRAQAMASGSSSFVQARPTGALSTPFVQPVGVRLGPSAGIGFPQPSVFPALNGTSRGGGATGGFAGIGRAGIATGRGDRFTFDKREGCVRLSLPGEKQTHRIDPQTGDFVRVKKRRINLLNLTAFKRAERRVDGLTRICRTLFKEERRKTTGKVQRRGKR